MKQLKMLRPAAPVRVFPLPAGYTFSGFAGTPEEIDDWLDICAEGLLPDTDPHWFADTIVNYPDLDPVGDLFFVLDPAGRRVGTCAAVCHKDGTGYAHMLGTLHCCRGQGIGKALMAHALALLEARGCPYTVLTTDDFRLAAVKGYLDAGYRPLLWNDPESDMRARWDAVIAALGYAPVEYLAEV